MEPFGIGLSEQHPAIMLALMVRKSDKKKTKPKPWVSFEKKRYLFFVLELKRKRKRKSLNMFHKNQSKSNPSQMNFSIQFENLWTIRVWVWIRHLQEPWTHRLNPHVRFFVYLLVFKSVFSANIAPPAQDPYNEPYHDSYRPDRDFDRRDNRDRDRRTFASRDYEPQRTSHWDNDRYLNNWLI